MLENGSQVTIQNPIFVVSTACAPALILGTSLRAFTFRIFREQRTIIRFPTPKGLRASTIAAELKSVYDTEAFTISTMKKWRKRLAEGRTSLCDDRQWKTTYQGLIRIHFLYVEGEAVSFMQGFLPALPHCRGSLLANSS
jgi:hypothetical protein